MTRRWSEMTERWNNMTRRRRNMTRCRDYITGLPGFSCFRESGNKKRAPCGAQLLIRIPWIF
jgi:hypothetical protein